MESSRERIRKFDKELIESREYPVWFYRMPAYFMEMLVFFIALSGDSIKEMNGLIWAYCWGLSFYIAPYMGIIEKQKLISIYEVLKYVPVNNWDIFKVRIEYIVKILSQRLLVMLVLQILFFVFTGRIVKNNIINSLITIGRSALVLTIYVLPVIHNYHYSRPIKKKG